MIVVRIMGGLGNQLFQYALALMLSKQGLEVLLQPHFHRDRYRRNYALEFLPHRLPILSGRQWLQMRHKFCNKWNDRLLRRIFRLPEPLIILDNNAGNWRDLAVLSASEDAHAIGYWQSARIVAKTPELLADLQNARDTLLPNMADMNGDPMIAVHARRLWEYDAHGKPVNRQGKKPTSASLYISTEYYRSAFEWMHKKYDNPRFFIFGDDPQWCTQNLLPLANGNGQLMPPNERPDWQDMLLMARCHGFILSNSSFAWWGATIGEGEVVAPMWRESDGARATDIYPPHWTIIK